MGCWTNLKKKKGWEEGPSQNKNEIQYIIYLRANVHTLERLSQENCTTQGLDSDILLPELENLYCSLLPAQRNLPSGKDPLWSQGQWAMSIKRWCLLTGVEPNKYTTSTS